MANVIYNYPKSSCECYNCNNKKYKIPEGVPTNMSVPGCKYSKYYDCYPKRIFKIQEEPVNRDILFTPKKLVANNKENSFTGDGLFVLNKSLVEEFRDNPEFRAINSESCPSSSCRGVTYLNSDPRLFNAAGGTWLQLDRPPIETDTKLKDLVTDKSLDNYGQNYKSYNDVNAGQILYYIDRNLQDAFYEPIFSKKATAVGTMYKDPMGNMRPQYDRIPNQKYDPILGNPCDVSGEYCLSWMKDTQHHREDLLALQMRSSNETRFAPRWTNTLGNSYL